MDRSAIIKACFSNYRTVPTRKSLQIILEVPLERQAEVFEALGYPMPDTDIWVVVARLNAADETAELEREESNTDDSEK